VENLVELQTSVEMDHHLAYSLELGFLLFQLMLEILNELFLLTQFVT
jgi:hypothetical protein